MDETSKLDLYLNALGLLSPSLVEGFGIPVLDGACLGMPTVASNCESHLEIQNLHDFAVPVFFEFSGDAKFDSFFVEI